MVAGRAGAVAELIDGYGRLVRRIVHRLVDDPQDREELWQDTFVLAVRGLARFRGDARLSTWIGRIAYRECVRSLRRRRVPLEVEWAEPAPDPGLESSAPALDLVVHAELASALQDAIERLPPVQKAAVTLFHVEEMSIAEVAEIMGVPANTVKSHLHRARARLRALLEKEAADRGYTR